MKLEPVIGLEIHLQLKTKSKMFCSCPAQETAVAPNSNVCPVCMGHPGTLPVPNEEAIRAGVLMGLALGCNIAPQSKFDRKHYFYPDLPKGYQISQYDLPIASNGSLTIEVPGNGERDRIAIGITRAHLEEDAAKNLHDEKGQTFVDFNRAGTPLLETVTEPDFRSPKEAKAFLQELRLIARYLGVSDADMEKGQMRCDANISLREIGEDGLPVMQGYNPKTEIKNVNSFRAVERALDYEIMRQTKIFETSGPVSISTTRGWNDVKQITEEQRTKEAADDYRYFPEPDIPPLELADIADEMRARLPELPAARRLRFADEYGLSAGDARVMCENPEAADYAEHVFSELQAWLKSLPELAGTEEAVWKKEKTKLARLVGGWLLSKLGGLMAEKHVDFAHLKIDAENFAEFITLLATRKLSTANGMTVLGVMLDTGQDPSQVMEDRQLGLVSDETAIATAVDAVLEANPAEVARYKAGEKQLLKFFIGVLMKETQGKADPGLAKNMLLVKLED